MSKRNRSSSSIETAKKAKGAPLEKHTHILDLNDYCLEDVISCLRPIDLCALKGTCHRFKSVADEYFRRKYSSEEFELSMKLQKVYCEDKILHSPYVVRMFGQFIRKLRIRNISSYRMEQATRFWNGIYENCTQLRELTIIDCDLALLRPIIVQTEARELENLSLTLCMHDGEESTQIMRYFANVKRLIIREISVIDHKFLGYNYPQLKEIRCVIPRIPRKFFEAFIRLNPQIEKLDFCFMDCECLALISETCKNIERIAFGCSYLSDHLRLSMDCLDRFAKLKELDFNCGFQSITSVVKILGKRNILESLSLNKGTLNSELCHALCELTNLKSLALIEFDGWNANLLKKILTGLKLEHFVFSSTYMEFEWIATVVKYSRSIKSIKLDYDCFDEPLQDTHFMQLVNSRKDSGAGFPLEIRTKRNCFFQISDSVQQIEENARFIRLK